MKEIETNKISWSTILDEPFVVLILGERGGGKTALGHLLLELFSDQGRRKPAYVIGFPMHKRHLLPDWITPLDEFYFPDNSVVLLHEAHFYLHARRSMESGHLEIDKLITISRHKNVDIIVETQQSFRLDRNIVAEVDAIIFRVPELMQEKFERPEVRWITQMAKEAFRPFVKEYTVKKDGKAIARYREVSPEAKKHAFIYSKKYVGMYPHKIPLPSYWNDEISRAYGMLKEQKPQVGMVGKILEILRANPEYAEYLERMLEWDEKKRDSEFYSLGFEWTDIRAPPQALRKLYLAGILKLAYSSNRRKGYLLKDPQAVKEALESL